MDNLIYGKTKYIYKKIYISWWPYLEKYIKSKNLGNILKENHHAKAVYTIPKMRKTKMKVRILAVEYPEENEQEVNEILNSVFFTNMLKRIAGMKNTEVTTPYDGEFDEFVNDIVFLLVSHDDAAKELVNAMSERIPHLPGLIKQFGLIRKKLENEEERNTIRRVIIKK
jgi:hypothetical protein